MMREPLTPAERAELVAGGKCESSASVAALMTGRIGSEVVEVMVVIGLDSRNVVLFCIEVARGGRSGLVISPADIYRVACATGASSIILSHNHPNGDPLPSPEDIATTRRIVQAGAVLGIPLVDHVIVTMSGRYQSLFDMGILEANNAKAA